MKIEIHLELDVPSDGLDVNQIVALSQEVQDELGPALVACYLEEAQDRELDRVLGSKWTNEPQGEAPWTRPECGSRQGFSRRGSYPRVLRKTSLGRIEFDLRQVTCRDRDRTFSPFTDWLGLEPYQVSTTEFQAQAVEVACQTTYARSVEHIRNLARVKVSATAVHQWAQDRGADVTLDVAQADDNPMIVDATKMCAGDQQRGCSLNLGLSVQGRSWTNGRPRLSIHPVCFGVDEAWSEMGQAVSESRPTRVVFDGDEDLVSWVEESFPDAHKQRGRWHLVRQLYWPLWEDGLNKSQAEKWMEKLGELVYHPENGVQETRTELKGLISQLSEEGLSHAAAYLAAAAPYTLTYREHPDGMFFDDERLEPLAISSTSPAERQMREINRRTDVGARWSVTGVENLISLDLIQRFDPQQWRALWHLPERASSDCSIVKLRVNAEAESPPNVKTS